ncbi:CLUMA_CG000270, isoform A [Clunio marinus]|uniref:CLUMA_CG000270, isoform A n=1 Tax=Clunio marinus TaxID=568069 RepID=A0A1J1HER4_9DIPT|nr:CLUMA_CG000270, isoform A [Clunio marinus]
MIIIKNYRNEQHQALAKTIIIINGCRYEINELPKNNQQLNDNYKFDTAKNSDLRDQNLNNEMLPIVSKLKITGELSSRLNEGMKTFSIDINRQKHPMKRDEKRRNKNKKNDFQKSNYIQICFYEYSFIMEPWLLIPIHKNISSMHER